MDEDEPKLAWKWFAWVGALKVGAIVGLILLIVILNNYRFVNRASDRAPAEVRLIQAALDEYIAEFGELPNEGSVGIIAALVGRNPQQKAFIEFPSYRFNAQGELLDPWMHPYRIDTSNPKALRVYSFGKNGIDEGGAEGSDDVASWR